jgi:hypothetical protein
LEVIQKLLLSLTSFGIKKIIPLLLEGVESKSTRLKVGCIMILGGLSECSTKVVSENLYIIVPYLTDKINSTNDEIKFASIHSLEMIL